MRESKKIKILHVVGAMNRAGTETMLMNIYRNVDRERVQFDFISYSQTNAHYDQEIKRLNGKVIKLSKTNSIKQIYQVIKKHGPYDAVHSHTLFHCGIASIAALLAGVKIRISHAHTTLDYSGGFLRKIYIVLMRLTINTFSTNLLACSREAGKYLFGKRGLEKTTYSFFPNVIDYSQFLVPENSGSQTEVKKFRVEAGFGNKMVIGHIGRFIEAKNHFFLLEIMEVLVKKDSNIMLLLVGEGNLRKQMEEEAKRKAISGNVRFVGVKRNIPMMLHSMDVFVFPSLYEGLGLVLLESQASGLPCIVSEAIQPEADLGLGLVTRLSLAEGPDIWAEKILKMANKKERNTNKLRAGFENNGYSLTKGISTLTTIYKSNAGEPYETNLDRFL